MIISKHRNPQRPNIQRLTAVSLGAGILYLRPPKPSSPTRKVRYIIFGVPNSCKICHLDILPLQLRTFAQDIIYFYVTVGDVVLMQILQS